MYIYIYKCMYTYVYITHITRITKLPIKEYSLLY